MAIKARYPKPTASSVDEGPDATEPILAERWNPKGGEAVVTDDLADAEQLAGTLVNGTDPLVIGLLTHQLITGLAEAGPDEDVTAAILASLPPLPPKTAQQ